jgi:hypothetical protein
MALSTTNIDSRARTLHAYAHIGDLLGDVGKGGCNLA